MQGPRTDKPTLKKNPAREVTLPDINVYYIITVTKIVGIGGGTNT